MIRVLPPHISNLIAAGEVVQRPSSVVKELMENSVDAGASNIHVVIKDSGKTLIQVIDDGCGLSPSDAVTAFLRHATSKIKESEDLQYIKTFGFRGEALASICSVANVTLRTKREESELGYQVEFAESNLISQGEVSTPKGSNFIVRNLFYNVPARRKFLKADSTEFKQILQEFSRVALTRPEISFQLTHNDSHVMTLPAAPLKKRIMDIAGRDMIKELVEIKVETSIINIRGFVGNPEDARKTNNNQYLFVNNRYFRSSFFQKAILRAYDNLIPEGLQPSFFIYFNVDTTKIDVNIHPSKTEVKFEEDFAISDIIHSATRESLGKNSFMPSIDFDMEGAPEIPKIDTSYIAPAPKIDYDPLFNPFKEESRVGNTYLKQYEIQNQEPLFSDSVSMQKPLLQVGNKYIITTIKSGVVFIDIRRAKERILYERYLENLSCGTRLTQNSLFPIELILDIPTLEILKERKADFQQMGFSYSINESSLSLNGLPDGFNDNLDSLPYILHDLAESVCENNPNFEEVEKERVAQMLAKSACSGKLETLGNIEAQVLVDSLFACAMPTITPDGRKCFFVNTLESIENNLDK